MTMQTGVRVKYRLHTVGGGCSHSPLCCLLSTAAQADGAALADPQAPLEGRHGDDARDQQVPGPGPAARVRHSLTHDCIH